MERDVTSKLNAVSHKRLMILFSRAALDRAAVLLKMSMGGLRIDNHWGSGGGQRPVIQLIKEVNNVRYNLCMMWNHILFVVTLKSDSVLFLGNFYILFF